MIYADDIKKILEDKITDIFVEVQTEKGIEDGKNRNGYY